MKPRPTVQQELPMGVIGVVPRRGRPRPVKEPRCDGPRCINLPSDVLAAPGGRWRCSRCGRVLDA